jgi:protein tyrosine phosphatase (PTP) superfamily phosphohydrolase (DUF442 family)
MSSPLLDAISGITNASQPLPHLVTGGQPLPTHLSALKEAGAEVVLDIRDPMEPRPLDEPATALGLGLSYEQVTVRQGALDDDVMEKVLGVLRRHEGKPILLHCASGNRVGGPLIAYLMIDKGMSEDQAVEAAMRAGLRGADVLEWGVDYARRKAGGA